MNDVEVPQLPFVLRRGKMVVVSIVILVLLSAAGLVRRGLGETSPRSIGLHPDLIAVLWTEPRTMGVETLDDLQSLRRRITEMGDRIEADVVGVEGPTWPAGRDRNAPDAAAAAEAALTAEPRVVGRVGGENVIALELRLRAGASAKVRSTFVRGLHALAAEYRTLGRRLDVTGAPILDEEDQAARERMLQVLLLPLIPTFFLVLLWLYSSLQAAVLLVTGGVAATLVGVAATRFLVPGHAIEPVALSLTALLATVAGLPVLSRFLGIDPTRVRDPEAARRNLRSASRPAATQAALQSAAIFLLSASSPTMRLLPALAVILATIFFLLLVPILGASGLLIRRLPTPERPELLWRPPLAVILTLVALLVGASFWGIWRIELEASFWTSVPSSAASRVGAERLAQAGLDIPGITAAGFRVVRSDLLTRAIAILFVAGVVSSIGFGSLRLAAVAVLPGCLPFLGGAGLAGFLQFPVDLVLVDVSGLLMALSLSSGLSLIFAYDRRHRRETATRRGFFGGLPTLLGSSILTLFVALQCLFTGHPGVARAGFLLAAATILGGAIGYGVTPALLLRFGPRPEGGTRSFFASTQGIWDRFLGRERSGRLLLDLASAAYRQGKRLRHQNPRESATRFREALRNFDAYLAESAGKDDDPRRRQRRAGVACYRALCLEGLDEIAGDDTAARPFREEVVRSLTEFETTFAADDDLCLRALSARQKAELKLGLRDAAIATLAALESVNPRSAATIDAHEKLALYILSESRPAGSMQRERELKRLALRSYKIWLMTTRPDEARHWLRCGVGFEDIDDADAAAVIYETARQEFAERQSLQAQSEETYEMLRRLARILGNDGKRRDTLTFNVALEKSMSFPAIDPLEDTES